MNEEKSIIKEKTSKPDEDRIRAMDLEKLKFEVAQEYGFTRNENNKKE